MNDAATEVKSENPDAVTKCGVSCDGTCSDEDIHLFMVASQHYQLILESVWMWKS